MLLAIETLANLCEFGDFALAFVRYLALCFAHFIVQSTQEHSISPSLSLSLILFALTYLMLPCAPISQFRISKASAKSLTKNKVVLEPQRGWLPQWGWLSGWCSEAQREGQKDLPTLFTTRLSSWRKRREARGNRRWARIRDSIFEFRETERREIYLTARLRLFGFLALTNIAPRTRIYIHIYTHTYICIGFFPTFGFRRYILRGYRDFELDYLLILP